MNQVMTTVMILAVCCALLAVSTSDYDEVVAQAEQYRSDVCAGVMPNYKQIEVECDE